MSGVRSGSRLEQLTVLRSKARHERQSADRRDDRHELERLDLLLERVGAAIDAERLRIRQAEGSVEVQLLHRLGVTARQVKEWGAGLLDAVRRGRIKHELVVAYAEHHQLPRED